jgi:arsenate reductase
LLRVQVKGIIRIKEKIYRDLSLKDADDNQLIQNILKHPILLERPIIKYKNKAVIGRPPENVLKLIN